MERCAASQPNPQKIEYLVARWTNENRGEAEGCYWLKARDVSQHVLGPSSQ